MDNSFLAYLQLLELLGFFSGYPLIYAVVFFIAGQKKMNAEFKKRLVSVLPYSYALVGTLYLGLQLRNLYPYYSIENLRNAIQQPVLIIFGLLSLLFWIPALAKKTFISLIHGIFFFLFIIRDLFLQFFTSATNKEIVQNDMKIYTDSLLLNLSTFTFILLLSLLFSLYKKNYRR